MFEPVILDFYLSLHDIRCQLRDAWFRKWGHVRRGKDVWILVCVGKTVERLIYRMSQTFHSTNNSMVGGLVGRQRLMTRRS